MPLTVVPAYAAALAVVFIGLSVRVILKRRQMGAGFGTGGSEDLARRVRSQANFSEYVPLALVLLSMAELNGAAHLWLHVFCAFLLVGRLAHAFGLARSATDDIGRLVGMVGSQTAILGGAALLLWRALAATSP